MEQEEETRNSKELRSFVRYCEEHPDYRFWQALRNWCGWSFVFVGKTSTDGAVRPVDTFHWEETREPH